MFWRTRKIAHVKIKKRSHAPDAQSGNLQLQRPDQFNEATRSLPDLR